MFDHRYQFHRLVLIRHENGDLLIEIGPRHESVFLFHAIFGAAAFGFVCYQLLPALVRGWIREPGLTAVGVTCFGSLFFLVPLFLSINGIWQFAGTETVRANPSERKLTICTSLYCFRWTRAFNFEEPQQLRLTKSFFFIVPCSVAFNAGKWRYEFATGASEEDRTRILHALALALGGAHSVTA